MYIFIYFRKMGKRKKAHGTAGEDLNRKIKNNKQLTLEDETDESKPVLLNTEPKDEKVKTKKKSQAAKDDVKKNKKIIFNNDNDNNEPDEPVEIQSPKGNQKTKQAELPQEKEEDVKDEDIDKFCDELNDEDNEQYESWVKLIEAQLHSNKKKPK